MAKMLSLCIVFILTILFNNSIADKCQQEGPCMCKFDEYNQINLTRLLPASTKFIQDAVANYTYFFSGCQNKLFKAQDYQLNSTQSFTASLIKCIAKEFRYNITDNSNKTATYTSRIHNCSAIGLHTQIKYDLSTENPNEYQIVYNVKEGSSPSINLGCVTFKGTNLKVENHESDVLMLYSPLVCVKHLSHHELSTGSIFCIIFFTAAIIYFIGGGIIMYTARGARGVEVIPNFDFWVSLPGLIRDGMVFILSGCRPFTVATAETYDRI